MHECINITWQKLDVCRISSKHLRAFIAKHAIKEFGYRNVQSSGDKKH